MTFEEYIKKAIDNLWADAGAWLADNSDELGLSHDETAGIPMEIFRASNYFQKCWQDYIRKKEKEHENGAN